MALPYARVLELGLRGLANVTYTADGAIALRPQYALLDASSANAQMTLANGGAAFQGKVMVIEAVDVSNTCDVDYNTSAGAQTTTFSAAGEVLLLMGTNNGVWKVIA